MKEEMKEKFKDTIHYILATLLVSVPIVYVILYLFFDQSWKESPLSDEQINYITKTFSKRRVCSINCVKVKSIKLNNFDYGKTTIEKEREENAFGRNNS